MVRKAVRGPVRGPVRGSVRGPARERFGGRCAMDANADAECVCWAMPGFRAESGVRLIGAGKACCSGQG